MKQETKERLAALLDDQNVDAKYLLDLLGTLMETSAPMARAMCAQMSLSISNQVCAEGETPSYVQAVMYAYEAVFSDPEVIEKYGLQRIAAPGMAESLVAYLETCSMMDDIHARHS